MLYFQTNFVRTHYTELHLALNVLPDDLVIVEKQKMLPI